MLDALQGRRHVVDDALHAHGALGEGVLAEDVGVLVVAVVEDLGLLGEPRAELGEVDVGPGGQREGEDHAGERGVDAGVVHADPQHEAHEQVGLGGVDLGAVQAPQDHDHDGRGRAPGDVGRLAVGHGDHDDGQDVVRDGEGLEEYLRLRADAVAQKRHDAERERDVRGDGHGPAVGEPARVEEQVDGRGHADAADSGEHGQGRLPGLTELADRHLVLELDAHEEEEDRHKEVVDEGLHGEAREEVAEAERDRGEEEVLHRLVRGAVCHHEGEKRRADHDGRGHGAVGRDLLESADALRALNDGRLLVDLADVGRADGHGRLSLQGAAPLTRRAPGSVPRTPSPQGTPRRPRGPAPARARPPRPPRRPGGCAAP